MGEKIKKKFPYFELMKKWFTRISPQTLTSIFILLILFLISFFCLEQGFIKNPLLLPGVLFIFVFFDFFIFLFNSHINYTEKMSTPQNSEHLKYYPNLKIWGIGFILGLAVFIFSYFEPLKEALLSKKHIVVNKTEITMGADMKIVECRVSSMELIQQIVGLLFFLIVLGIILAAIVKIVKDE